MTIVRRGGTILAMQRVKSYLRGLGAFIFALLAITGALVLVQFLFHPFDPLIAYLDQDLAAMDRSLSREAVAGVSLGGLVLVALVAFLPLIQRGIRKRQYAGSLFRGIIAAGIFFVSDRFYSMMEGFGRFYLTVAVIAAGLLTIVLVEIAVRMGRSEEEAASRTDMVASIVSGLVFALVLRLGSQGLRQIGAVLGL